HRRRGELPARGPAREAPRRCRHIGSCVPPSQVEHESFGFRARNTDLHHLVRCPLAFAQDVVAMIGNPLDDSGLADPAIAALAVMYRVFAGLEQHVEDGLAGRNLVDAPAAFELDLETGIAGLLFWRAEDFEMQPPLR